MAQGYWQSSGTGTSDGSTTEETVTGTTYTVVAADFDGKTKVFTHASGCLVTIPVSAASTAGQVFQWRQAAGAGQITFQGDGTSTVDSSDDSLTSGGELTMGAVVHLGSDDFLLVGQIGTPRLVQNSQSAAYGLVLADAGKHLLHPSADVTARTFTIPANSSVAFPVGTVVTFVNQASAGVLSIAITTDTMRLAGAGTTGTRALAANGVATAIKLTSTEWIISGTGLT